MEVDFSRKRGTYMSGSNHIYREYPCGQRVIRCNSGIKTWERLHFKVCSICSSRPFTSYISAYGSITHIHNKPLLEDLNKK